MMRVLVQNLSQIQPARLGLDIASIKDSFLIEHCCSGISLLQVRCDVEVVINAGSLYFLSIDKSDAALAYQPNKIQ